MGMARTGRPTKLTQPRDTTPDGTPLTHAQHVIDSIRLGLDYQTAADSAGISRQTIHNWQLKGARYAATQAQGHTITPQQQAYVDFVDGVKEAESDREASYLAVIKGCADGGHRMVRTVVKRNKDGDVVETVETSEHLRPEWTAAAWWLERRMPEKYRRRTEITGADGVPLVPPAEQARAVEQALADFQAGAETAKAMENDAAGAD